MIFIMKIMARYRRADIRENEILAFSSDVIHGNRVHNESPNTRCSLDFKAFLDDYDENTLTDRIILKRVQKFKQKDCKYSKKLCKCNESIFDKMIKPLKR